MSDADDDFMIDEEEDYDLVSTQSRVISDHKLCRHIPKYIVIANVQFGGILFTNLIKNSNRTFR